MKTNMITLLAVGLFLGTMLVPSEPASALTPPGLQIGSPGSFDRLHRCYRCRLVDDDGPVAVTPAPTSERVSDVALLNDEPQLAPSHISWWIFRLVFHVVGV